MKETKQQKAKRQSDGIFHRDELGIKTLNDETTPNPHAFYKPVKETKKQRQARQEEGYYRVGEIQDQNPKSRCAIV